MPLLEPELSFRNLLIRCQQAREKGAAIAIGRGRHHGRQALYLQPPSSSRCSAAAVLCRETSCNVHYFWWRAAEGNGLGGKCRGNEVGRGGSCQRGRASPTHLQTLECPSHRLPRITLDLTSSDGFPLEKSFPFMPHVCSSFREVKKRWTFPNWVRSSQSQWLPLLMARA